MIAKGSTDDALWYELSDMEAAVKGDTSRLHIDYTEDVMRIMTDFRKQWGLTYPEEEG